MLDYEHTQHNGRVERPEGIGTVYMNLDRGSPYLEQARSRDHHLYVAINCAPLERDIFGYSPSTPD